MQFARDFRDAKRDLGPVFVYIYHNGVQLFSAYLANWSEVAVYATALTVQSGDIVDCAVSPTVFYGSNTYVDVVLTTTAPSTGACCFETRGCLVGTPAECAAVGGAYMGDGTLCEPDPCGAVPVESTTWGRVKSEFR